MPSFTSWASSVLLASSALARPQHQGTGPPSLRQRRAATDPLSANATATATSNITLTPITLGDRPTTSALTPQPNITLPYGSTNNATAGSAALLPAGAAASSPPNDAVVNITLTTIYDGVLLEGIENLASVDCTSDSVRLTFNDTDTLQLAHDTWSSYAELLLVTNHVGDCDTEFERGFFVSSSFEAVEADLTLVAGATKKSVTDVASYMRANFSGIPGSSSSTSAAAKRDIVVDPDSVTVSADFDFGPITLFEYENYVSVTAQTAEVDVSVMLSGYLDFDIWTLSVESLYVDVETAASAALALDVNVTASYNDTFSYDVGYEYYVLDVAGLLTFGPAVALSVGAALDLAASVDASLALGAAIANGTLHLDLVGGDAATADGWDEATYYANLTLAKQAAVDVTPFVSLTVGVDFEILGGLVDLSSGLTPRLNFPTTAKLDAEQDVSMGSATNGTFTVTQPGGDGMCTNGLDVKSDFQFTLDAFVTEYWNQTLYSYTADIVDECYSWV